jgi:hypothetical protein
MHRPPPLFLLFFVVGCGGLVGPGLDGGGDAKSNDAVADAAPDAVDCNQRLAELSAAAAMAAQCCATCNVAQCTQQLDGICCGLTVNDKSSTASAAYLNKLAAVRAAGCGPHSCPSPQILGCSSTGATNVCGSGNTCKQ